MTNRDGAIGVDVCVHSNWDGKARNGTKTTSSTGAAHNYRCGVGSLFIIIFPTNFRTVNSAWLPSPKTWEIEQIICLERGAELHGVTRYGAAPLPLTLATRSTLM